MVAYGKSLQKSRRPGWEAAYLNYKGLKRILKDLEECTVDTTLSPPLLPSSTVDALEETESTHLNASWIHDDNDGDEEENGGGRNGVGQRRSPESMNDIKARFFQELSREIEKMSLFVLQALGDLADTMGTVRFENNKPVASLFHKEQHVLQRYSTSFVGTQESEQGDQELKTYLKLGIELLHIMQFVAINSVGIRKILKKYNKAVQQLDEPQYYHIMDSGLDDVHLQSVANSQSVAALQSSLQTALVEFYSGEQASLTSSSASTLTYDRSLLYFRFQSIMQASYMIRRSLKIVNQPFREYLSRKAMIYTGSNLGDMDGTAGMRDMERLMSFDPDSLLTFEKTRLDALWQDWVPGYKTRMQQVAFGSEKRRDENRLLETTKVAMRFLEEEEEDYDKVPGQSDGEGSEKVWGGADAPSMALNLVSILLYTINYYIVSPTANHYATILGTDGAFGATLIGASSFSAIFAAFLYSFWYTKASFKSLLIFSTLCPLLGNLIYALAISYDSMGMAIGGRILCGFGSAEVANRQMISACVSFNQMTRASAFFVAFGALGMSIGPLIAAILDNTAGRDLNIDFDLPFTPTKGIIYNHVTAPGFFMALLWLIEMVCLICFFQEPDRINGEEMADLADGDDGFMNEIDKEYGSMYKRESIADSTASTNTDRSSVSILIESLGAWEELKTTWKLVTKNPGLPVTLLLFCYVELADEILISSCSMVVRRYFGWHASAAGFLIAALGAVVLPANYLVESFSHKFSERRILKWSLWLIIGGLLLILNYQGMYYDLLGISQYGGFDPDGTVNIQELVIGGEKVGTIMNTQKEFPYNWNHGIPIYITFLSVVFMGTIILEGVDTSIMAQVTPSQLNDRFINSGLLATLFGTLGRVLSDSMITMSAFLDLHVFVDFVNAIFIPLLFITLGCIAMARTYYHCLV